MFGEQVFRNAIVITMIIVCGCGQQVRRTQVGHVCVPLPPGEEPQTEWHGPTRDQVVDNISSTMPSVVHWSSVLGETASEDSSIAVNWSELDEVETYDGFDCGIVTQKIDGVLHIDVDNHALVGDINVALLTDQGGTTAILTRDEGVASISEPWLSSGVDYIVEREGAAPASWMLDVRNEWSVATLVVGAVSDTYSDPVWIGSWSAAADSGSENL